MFENNSERQRDSIKIENVFFFFVIELGEKFEKKKKIKKRKEEERKHINQYPIIYTKIQFYLLRGCEN